MVSWWELVPSYSLWLDNYYVFNSKDYYYSWSFPKYYSELLSICWFTECVNEVLVSNTYTLNDLHDWYGWIKVTYENDNNNNGHTGSVSKTAMDKIREFYNMLITAYSRGDSDFTKGVKIRDIINKNKDLVEAVQEMITKNKKEVKNKVIQVIKAKLESSVLDDADLDDVAEYLKHVSLELQKVPSIQFNRSNF